MWKGREREKGQIKKRGRYYCSSSTLNGVYMYLTVEDVVWCVLLELEVPDESDSIWVMGDVLVGEVGDEQELWVLRRVCVWVCRCVCVWGGGGGEECGALLKQRYSVLSVTHILYM